MISKEIINEVISIINSRDFDDYQKDINNEDAYVELDGSIYCFIRVEDFSDDWVDEGKYQFIDSVVEIVEVDEDWKTIERSGIFVRQSTTRSGSYFSGYYYNYGEVTIVERKVKIVPEHKIVVYE